MISYPVSYYLKRTVLSLSPNLSVIMSKQEGQMLQQQHSMMSLKRWWSRLLREAAPWLCSWKLMLNNRKLLWSNGLSKQLKLTKVAKYQPTWSTILRTQKKVQVPSLPRLMSHSKIPWDSGDQKKKILLGKLHRILMATQKSCTPSTKRRRSRLAFGRKKTS